MVIDRKRAAEPSRKTQDPILGRVRALARAPHRAAPVAPDVERAVSIASAGRPTTADTLSRCRSTEELRSGRTVCEKDGHCLLAAAIKQ